MSRPFLLIIAFSTMILSAQLQEATSQDRGRDSDDDDGDRNRGDSNRREEFRSRFGSGSPWGGGFPGGGFPWGGSRGGDNGDNNREDWRSRFGGESRGENGDSRSDGRREDSRSSKTPSKYVPKPHDPVAVQLPDGLLDGDANADGQITLFEWRQWKPQDFAGFYQRDINHDGFLTAREVIIAENFPPGNAPPLTASSTTAAPTPTAIPTQPAQDSEGNLAPKPSLAEAQWAFGVLDKDRNGSLTEVEWQTSQAAREGFKKAGIAISFPINREAFIKLYPYERILPQMRIPGS